MNRNVLNLSICMVRRVISLLIICLVCFAPLFARAPKTVKHPTQKIYLECNALTTSYTYSTLRGEIAEELTQNGCMLVHSADEADWTIQVVGSIGALQKTEFGSRTFFSSEVNISIMIDKGAYAKRVFETTLTEQGKHTSGFDEAAVEAYKLQKPHICEIIKQHIQ